MTDYLTPELLDALEAEFSAEREHRKQSWRTIALKVVTLRNKK